jgi:hypothetical protein
MSSFAAFLFLLSSQRTLSPPSMRKMVRKQRHLSTPPAAFTIIPSEIGLLHNSGSRKTRHQTE